MHLDHDYHRVVLQRSKDVLVEHHLHVVVPDDLALDLGDIRRMVHVEADGAGSSCSRTTGIQEQGYRVIRIQLNYLTILANSLKAYPPR